MEKLPIIILNYNTSADCAKCISFLQRQEEVDIEIVVVDNNSNRTDLDTLRNICATQHCTLIESHENRGYNAGNNIGLRYAADEGYRYALIANPDMEFPDTHYLATLMVTAVSHPDAAVIGSDIVHHDGFHQNPIDDNLNSKRLKTKKNKYDTSTGNYWESRYCYKVSGCCILIQLSFLIQINFFDENIFLYCEESILSTQIVRNNMKCYYCADTSALHNHIRNKKLHKNNAIHHWKNSTLYYIKQYDDTSLLRKHVKCMIFLSRYYTILLKNLFFTNAKSIA